MHVHCLLRRQAWPVLILAIAIPNVLATPTRVRQRGAGEESIGDAWETLGSTLATASPKSDTLVERAPSDNSCKHRSQQVCTESADVSPTLTERADPISPLFFFKESRFRIKCAKPEFAITRTARDNHQGVPIGPWTNWLSPDYPGGRAAALVRMRWRQDSCKVYCRCDEDGKLVKQLQETHIRLGRPPKTRLCSYRQAAERCVIMYACFCDAELIQPKATATDIALSDYQAALDKIPRVIKMRNPQYKWNYGAGELTFSEPGKNAGDAKEPYYVEGPSTDRELFGDRPKALNVGYGLGSLADLVSGASGLMQLSKRESEAEPAPMLLDAGDGTDSKDKPAVLVEDRSVGTVKSLGPRNKPED